MASDVTALHVIPELHPRSGGTSRAVVDITDALATQPGIAVTLLTQSPLHGESLASASLKVRRVVAESRSRFAITLGLPLREELNRIISAESALLIHNHGLWRPVNHWAASAGRRYGIPLIVQPHGMLEPWALNRKVWKKKVAMALFQSHDLKTAKLLLATSNFEYVTLRSLGFRQPIAVIPHGVVIASPNNLDVAVSLPPRRQRIALFLSRVHPVKGLLNLVNAWANLAPRGWKLRIVGPDEAGHLQDVMRAVQQFGISESVEYLGEVDGKRKSAVYQSADLFVLPSFSESFGIVVAEALAHGVPVITTRGTPWEGLVNHGCGWWIEPTVDALTETLREALGKDAASLQAMGEKGRIYAGEFDWPHIAQQIQSTYRWVLGQGRKPECVILE